MNAREFSGRQLKILSRSYSVPSSTVDSVDVGDISPSIGDVSSGAEALVGGDGDAAAANAVAINQQVGRFYVVILCL